jgi:hypothetical protein
MENKDLYAVMVIGQQTPSKVYENYWEAENEASRLARHTRKNVYVLKVVTLIELSDVVITRYELPTAKIE